MKFQLGYYQQYIIEKFDQQPAIYINEVPIVRMNKQQEEDERDKKERNVLWAFDVDDDIEYSDEEDAKEEDKEQDEQC